MKAARKQFLAEMATTDPEDLVFLDESSSNAAMAREYGRSPVGERVGGVRPAHKGRNLSMLATLTLDGPHAAMTVTGSTTGEVFLAFVRQVVVPKLVPGQIVVMDNYSAHKVAGVQEAIESAGARVWYLPPYSPDLNPIEEFWSKIKNHLRSCAARTIQALNEAIGRALLTVTELDCIGWYRHCLNRAST